jgi:hypothetical protein
MDAISREWLGRRAGLRPCRGVGCRDEHARGPRCGLGSGQPASGMPRLRADGWILALALADPTRSRGLRRGKQDEPLPFTSMRTYDPTTHGLSGPIEVRHTTCGASQGSLTAALSADGARVIASDFCDHTTVYAAASGRVLRKIKTAQGDDSVTFSPNGRQIVDSYLAPKRSARALCFPSC